jgi:hypothetical protein
MEFKYCVIGEICYQYIRNIDDEINEKEVKFRRDENIIPYKDYDMYYNFIKNQNNLNFFTYVLLLNTLIPISLIITVEIVKLLQGVYMYYNANSYSHLRKKVAKAKFGIFK